MKLRWNGRTISYRAGTDDVVNIEKILLRRRSRREYWIPESVGPATVLDCGANIGLATLHFQQVWPGATIFALEPFEENYELLVENTRGLRNVIPIKAAAGDRNGPATLWGASKSRTGGMTLHREYAGKDAGALSQVNMIRLDSLLAERKLNHFDVIKLDTEGSEAEILESLPADSLARSKWVVGELHGRRDWEVTSQLTKAGFAIDVKKNLAHTHFKFSACNRSIFGEIVGEYRGELKYLQA